MQYTENYSMNKPQFGENALVTKLNENADTLDTLIYNTRQMQADSYDSTQTYNTGDLVSYNSALYICLADNVTGTWDSTKWSATTLAEQVELAKQMGGESALADLDDVEITNPSTGQALLFDDSDDKWKNQNLPDVSVTKEASGNPIELTDAANAPIVKCVTEIQGSQDLHGYDKPWVGGAGVNFMPPLTSGTYTNGNATITVSDNGNINIKNTGVNSQGIEIMVPFSISFTPPSSYYAHLRNTIVTTTAGGAIAASIENSSYQAAGNFQIKVSENSIINCTNENTVEASRIRVYISASVGLVEINMKLSLENGSTATSYEPYSNICPITAYTEGEIEVSDGDGNVTTHTTTYPSAIYRGSEDVVNGTVGANSDGEMWLVVDLGDLTWTVGSTTQSGKVRFRTDDITDLLKPSGSSVIGQIICEQYEAKTSTEVYNCIDGIAIEYVEGFDHRLWIYDESKATLTGAQFKTAMSGIKIAYRLATPTTSSVTPTNLPIKSLLGYNHIESSTGDMEVEYITQDYQPLVDLIQSGTGHTYSTSEQVVGKWIDGSDLYEQTITGAADYDVTGLNVVEIFGVGQTTSGAVVPFPYNSGDNLMVWIGNYSGTDLLKVSTTYTLSALYRTIRYTKSTQTRSLSTPLTSQKAQIEPLDEKEEEVSTEEEKAVNEEENNDETR